MALYPGPKRLSHKSLAEQPKQVILFNVTQGDTLERTERQDVVPNVVLNTVPPLLPDALRLKPRVLFGNFVENAPLDRGHTRAHFHMQDVPLHLCNERHVLWAIERLDYIVIGRGTMSQVIDASLLDRATPSIRSRPFHNGFPVEYLHVERYFSHMLVQFLLCNLIFIHGDLLSSLDNTALGTSAAQSGNLDTKRRL
jgi:hypothetical protein